MYAVSRSLWVLFSALTIFKDGDLLIIWKNAIKFIRPESQLRATAKIILKIINLKVQFNGFSVLM